MRARRPLLCLSFFGAVTVLTAFTQRTVVLDSSEQQAIKAPKVNVSEAVHYNVQLGLAYLKAGDVRRAHYKLSKAIKLDANSAEAHYAFAFYSETLGQMEKAQQEYLAALKIAPNDPHVLNNYGTFLCKQGKMAESIPYLLAAAKQADYVNRADSYENAGLCAQKLGDLAHAEHYFQQASQLDPHNTQVLWDLINLSYQQEQNTKTLVLLKRYLLIDPENHKANILLQQLQAKLAKHHQS